MPSKKITSLPNWAGAQVSTDLLTGVDLSQPAATENVKTTLNDLFSIITKNITDLTVRYQNSTGAAPALSAANTGAFNYNSTTQTFQGSRNGSAYENLLFGTGSSHQVAYWGPLVDELLGNNNFQNFPAASPEVRIVQQATNHIAFNVTSVDNVDSTFPLAKYVSADGLCEITITPGATAFATDALSQILIRNTSAAGGARVASFTIQDTVSANLPFWDVLNNFGSELLGGVNGTTTAGTNTLNVANSCLIKSCCPEGFFLVADDGGRENMYFVTGSSAFSNINFTVDTEKNVVMGSAALATNATNGFFYMNACAGIPTANPNPTVAIAFWNRTGRVPTNYDSTNAVSYAFLGSSWLAMSRIKARVSTQFDKTNSAALANITGLSVNVAAGKTYAFEAILYTESANTGGVQAAIAGTATATAIIYEAITYDSAAVDAQTRATALGSAVGGITNVTAALMRITGTITVNAAGTLTVQFAQNNSDGTPSSVLVGSVFLVDQIL